MPNKPENPECTAIDDDDVAYCDECGSIPAKGNLVYISEGGWHLCSECNPKQLPKTCVHKESECCKFCGRLGECDALCRPLTVADCLQVPEVRALVADYCHVIAIYRAQQSSPERARLEAFLAALEKEKDHE